MTDERRRRERFEAENVFAAITVVGGCDQGLGLITNVSEGGLCIRTPIPPPRFAKCVLKINMDEEHHEVKALVRRVEQAEGPYYDVGMQFAIRDPGRTRFIESFLTRTEG